MGYTSGVGKEKADPCWEAKRTQNGGKQVSAGILQYATQTHRACRWNADADIDIGFVPFLGYHHVLMILIMVAIILLCEPPFVVVVSKAGC